ncbi:MAG: hypothetical protein K2Q22_05390 [Cytophagales bacterium]|nr:hypothetical protein [Cytophagales bacterium]
MGKSIRNIIIVFLALVLGQVVSAFAQEEEKSSIKDSLINRRDDLGFLNYTDTLLKGPKKKKIKRNTFYGIKTRKAYTSSGEGTKEVLELFYVLKKWRDPSPYVQEIYWLDVTTLKLMITPGGKVEKEKALILHGPYRKLSGGKIIEEGVFYVGSKHARWERYNADGILLDKVKYYRGWPKEGELTYYDVEKQKVREMKPFVDGKMEGTYFFFYPSGKIKIKGMYKNNVQFGVWTEYYDDDKNRKKKETQYTKDEYVTDFEPVDLREWDAKGKIIYDKEPAPTKKRH